MIKQRYVKPEVVHTEQLKVCVDMNPAPNTVKDGIYIYDCPMCKEEVTSIKSTTPKFCTLCNGRQKSW